MNRGLIGLIKIGTTIGLAVILFTAIIMFAPSFSETSVSDTITGKSVAYASTCGNAVHESGEECDDGNNVNGDGCSANCIWEEINCLGADYVFDNFDTDVAGVNCNRDIPHIDADTVNVPAAGRYLVKGVVDRNQYGFQCQTGEEFKMEINGELGSEVPDDPQPCVGTRKLQEIGTFNFNSGWNNVIMRHIHSCPPDSSSNSVAVHKLCLYLKQQCGNSIVEPGEECDNGGSNGVACTPPYGGTCTYCSSQCKEITLSGPYCGDGGVNSGYETCEYPNTNNNDNCPQSQETCSGNKLGTRDAYGNCNSQCGCAYDSFSYSCDKGKCNADCGSDSDCSSKCVNGVRYYNGNCDTGSSCSCSYSTENCNNYDGWYDTGNKNWVNSGLCTEKEQKEQEYRDYGCSPSQCTYSVTQTKWVDTGNTRNKPDGTVCASETGICEADDVCQSGACVEKYAPDTTECRASAGVCDITEYCTGTSNNCPSDSFKPNTYTCRASAGICDLEEKCTGSSASCSSDSKKPNTYTCRASAGECDLEEKCTGTSNNCPSDSKKPNTYECRASGGICDVVEYCTGASNDCPSDSKKPNTYVCRDSAGICDLEEKCTGSLNDCPADGFKPDTTICREATVQCDETEYCTGLSENCPADSNKPDGTTCNDGLFCTEPDTCISGECSGTTKDCGDGIVCTGDSCDEDADACVNTPNNAYCNDGLWCNGTEYCDALLGCQPGTSPDCTDDLFCTVNERCNEDTDSCVTDPRDCSGNNITGIATCDNIPDNITYTWDYRQWFTSQCDEGQDVCTQGNDTITHACDVLQCDAECDDTHACEGNSCEGVFFDYCNNTKLVEYDDDKILDNTTVSDSCDNTCQSDCVCTDCEPDCSEPETNEYCVGGVCGAECSIDAECNDTYCTQVSHKTYPAGECTDDCGCKGDGYPVCVVGSCGAECDEDTDCGCSEDYCDGTTLVDYPDYGRCGTAGEEGCMCQNSTDVECEPALIPYHPQCVECLNNTGCNHLDNDYCGNNSVMHDEGVCVNYECEVNTTTTENCGTKNGIIGCGELNWTCSEELNQVDCVITDIEPKDNLCSDFCNADEVNNGFCNATNYMCYYEKEDCNAYDTSYCSGTSILFDNYTCNANNVTCALSNTTETENCNNGLWCDGQETCSNATCFAGTSPDCTDDLFCTINEYCDEGQDACASEPRECSGNNITGIATCNNTPDNITYTWDYRNIFVSECDEGQDICTQGNTTITHTCDVAQCSAECEQDSDCANNCAGSVRYFNGTCQGACECSYETENCDALDYYDDFVEYCNSTSHYRHRKFHDFSCSPDGCAETVEWVEEELIEDCSQKNGIMNDCGLMNWTCSEELNQVECVMTDVLPQKHLCSDYCDNTFTNTGSCNATTYRCDYITENCDNGLWCDGQETCANATCVSGTSPDCTDDLFCTINEYCNEENDTCASEPRDCSGNNITGIATCDNIPDNITYTWDYRQWFTSQCNEGQDICTQGNENITHACDVLQCSAECEQDSDCGNKCVGDVRYYNGTCDTATTCGCSWDTEDCSQYNGWYDTGNTTWIDVDACNEKEQKEQEYRIYGCSPGECAYSVNETQWIDTNNTGYKPDGTVCESDSGACDIDDTCMSGVCVEKYAPDTTECRASAEVCDVSEYCTGDSAVCPDNTFKPDTYTCRASAGVCDVEEKCTGNSTNCPSDSKQPNTYTCRASADVCDVPEYCTGSSNDCPSDSFKPSTTQCRESAGECDIDEYCTGSSASCPADSYMPDTYTCRASAGICDVEEKCTGSNALCPSDSKQPNTYTCRASVGICDLEEKCTGTSNECLSDDFKPDTYQCRARADICDVEEYCTGTTAACPTDIFKPNTTICRASVQQCDATEYCTGSSVSCSDDANVTDGTTCNDGLWCSVSDACMSGICSGGSRDCSDSLFCTIEHCDEDLDQCVDDGPRDCSANDISGVETCNDTSDNISSTWDYRQSFTSVCDENNDLCTQGNATVTHTCDKDECNATCEVNCNCPVDTCTEVYFDYCEGYKLVEYDNDKVLDRTAVSNSIKNLCQGNCECTNMTAECPPPSSNTYCVQYQCGAQCDSHDDCDDGKANTIDGCTTNCGCTHTQVQACYASDATGPNTTNITAIPYYNNGTVNVTAKATDNCTVIKTAEYFVGSGIAQCGANGTGATIYPANDKQFNLDNMIENLDADVETQSQGTNFVCIRSQDYKNNWGNCACAYFETDVTAPNTTKTFGGPYSFDVSTGITYMVANETQINMSCLDTGAILNGTTIYYRYFIDGVLAQDWTVYTNPIKFTEKKEHILEYYCIDAVGNREATKTETDIVNDTIQDTTKTCDGPGCSVIIPGYGNYFAVGWNTFFLPKFILDDINFNCGVEPYETEDVLASIDSTDPGFKSIWYFNGNDWDYYQPGYAFNDLTSFNDMISNPYFIYMNRVDRLEINGC